MKIKEKTHTTSIHRSATLGIAWDFTDPTQAKIASVRAGGPAASAGLRAGDVVVRIGNQALDQLQGGALVGRVPGEKLPLTYRRDGALVQATVTLGTEEERSYRLRPLARPTTLQARILASLSGGTVSGSTL